MPSGMVAVFCSLLLAMLLAACGGGITSTSTPTATPRPSPTPTPTPALTLYTGKGFSIGYPQGWKVTPGDGQVDFADANDIYHVTIMLHPNSGGAVAANTLINVTTEAVKKAMKNPKTEPLPATATVGGESWVQQSISGTETTNGQDVNLQVVLMSVNHPAHAANTQNFIILYGTAKEAFSTGDTSYFQPMLKSFKFI